MEDQVRTQVLQMVQALAPAAFHDAWKELEGKDMSVNADDLLAGKPLSVYLIVPAAKQVNQIAMLQFLIEMMLYRLSTSQPASELPPLFVLEDCGLLREPQELQNVAIKRDPRTAVVWSFWRNLTQVRAAFPTRWPEVIQSSAALQFFGIRDYSVCCDMAALMGAEPEDLRLLRPNQQIVCRDGQCLKLRQVECPR
jgi:hypothetical protein